MREGCGVELKIVRLELAAVVADLAEQGVNVVGVLGHDVTWC
jgi:hypothetical protein